MSMSAVKIAGVAVLVLAALICCIPPETQVVYGQEYSCSYIYYYYDYYSGDSSSYSYYSCYGEDEYCCGTYSSDCCYSDYSGYYDVAWVWWASWWLWIIIVVINILFWGGIGYVIFVFCCKVTSRHTSTVATINVPVMTTTTAHYPGVTTTTTGTVSASGGYSGGYSTGYSETNPGNQPQPAMQYGGYSAPPSAYPGIQAQASAPPPGVNMYPPQGAVSYASGHNTMYEKL